MSGHGLSDDDVILLERLMDALEYDGHKLRQFLAAFIKYKNATSEILSVVFKDVS